MRWCPSPPPFAEMDSIGIPRAKNPQRSANRMVCATARAVRTNRLVQRIELGTGPSEPPECRAAPHAAGRSLAHTHTHTHTHTRTHAHTGTRTHARTHTHAHRTRERAHARTRVRQRESQKERHTTCVSSVCPRCDIRSKAGAPRACVQETTRHWKGAGPSGATSSHALRSRGTAAEQPTCVGMPCGLMTIAITSSS